MAFAPTRWHRQIALGTFGYGQRVPVRAATEALERFVELGGFLIDTAASYGDGFVESFLQRWIARTGHAVAVATKVGLDAHDPGKAVLDPGTLVKDAERSRERLGVEAIDMLWLHRDDPRIPVDEIGGALAGLRDAGVVKAAGCSNWTVERTLRLLESSPPGERAVDAVQPMWSLAARASGGEEPWLVEYGPEDAAAVSAKGLLVVPFRTLGFGYFARTPDAARDPEVADFVRSNYDTPLNRRRRERARLLAARHGCTASAVALAYLRSFGPNIVPIVGASSAAQIEESMGARSIDLGDAELRWLAGGPVPLAEAGPG